ncbi:MAG: NYN domain-containing protein [Firmicutes bacterium]|nr:NYN domain-containing protein [Bacillota bacterium]
MDYHNERVAIFVDGANMFYAQRVLGWHLDFARVIEYFTRGRQLYNAFYYTACKCPPDNSQRDFLTALRHLGFTIREKSIKETMDQSSNAVIRRANLDIEIVVDMFNTATRYDLAILMSGDGDFERAVELLRSKGKEIVGVGTRGMISSELENACDRYVKLEDIRSEVEKIR